MQSSVRVGIVGATGAVGVELLELLERRNFPVGELRLLASARSAGRRVAFRGEELEIRETREAELSGLDYLFLCAGAEQSRTLGPLGVKAGAVVIDNSSAFRMDPEVPLVVPEVNPEALRGHGGLIANPNCSTAITLMGLAPLHEAFGLEWMICSTYQAVSGAGAGGMEELTAGVEAWQRGEEGPREVFPHPIAFNLLPHVDRFEPGGYTREEHKMRDESRKILGLEGLPVSCTCVRVPVFRAHAISVTANFREPVDRETARAAVAAFPGAQLIDEPEANRYPLPLEVSGEMDCAVGRIRVDEALPNGLSLWVVGDQLWKGAALNALQIAETLEAQADAAGVTAARNSSSD